MNDIRHIAREFISALSVLALVFLSLNIQPITGDHAPAIEAYQVSVLSFCGDAPAHNNHAHGPCHACRSSIALLPAPPCAVEPAYTQVLSVANNRTNDTKPATRTTKPFSARAPPMAA